MTISAVVAISILCYIAIASLVLSLVAKHNPHNPTSTDNTED